MYEYAQITVFDIFLSNSLVLGYSASLSSLVRIAKRQRMTQCIRLFDPGSIASDIIEELHARGSCDTWTAGFALH
jgi:hypothetical protein